MATPAQIAARKKFAERARSGELAKMRKKSAPKKARAVKSNPITETLIYGLPQGETRDYMEELLYGGGLKLTDAQINQVLKAASDAGYHSFRIAGFDPTMRPDFTKAIATKSRRKRNPAKTVSEEISQQMRKGKPQKQAIAIALEMERAGKLKKNPISDVAQTIYQQLGANRFVAMTGAKNLVGGENYLMFSIPRNMSPYNKVKITYLPGRDLYDVDFMKVTRAGGVAKAEPYNDVYAEQLRELFRNVTGMETSLGTMGRRSNPSATRAPARPRTKLISNGREKNPKSRVRVADLAGTSVPEYKVAYAVHLADRPSYHALAYFTKKADAIEAAQEVADRNNLKMAVSRVQIHFGNI